MNKNKMIFFGTSNLAKEMLISFLHSKIFQVDLVVSTFDKSPLALFCQKKNIPLFCPSVFDAAAEKKIKSLKADIFAVIDFGKIIPSKILDLSLFGAFNLHFSLLPKYRGASPVQSAILQGEKESGITVFRLTKNLDDGDIFWQKKINIDSLRADEVFSKMMQKAAIDFVEILEKIVTKKNYQVVKQDHQKATFCKKFKKEDGLTNPLKETCQSLIQKVNAFYPWPGVFFKLPQIGLIKLLRVEKTNVKTKASQGKFFTENKKLFLSLKDGNLKILEIQRAGKKAMKGEDFARGFF